MNLVRRFSPLVLLLCVFACGSSDDKEPTQAAGGPGQISATASGIEGQNGKIYTVAVFDYNWVPGAQTPPVGGIQGYITGDDFSFSAVMHTLDASGQPTAIEKTFAGGTYSVVFYVMPAGSPPQYFTEVRVVVNGDINVTAQPWGRWVES
jgi:hypothetical protein